MPNLQAAYASDLDRVTGRIRRACARGEFHPIGRTPTAVELVTFIEARLARQLREAPPEAQNDILDLWYSALELRRLLGCDESPADRPPHVHDASCCPGGCERRGLSVDGEDFGYELPGKPVPHPNGGHVWTAWGHIAVDTESEDCGVAIGSATELPADYTEEWAC